MTESKNERKSDTWFINGLTGTLTKQNTDFCFIAWWARTAYIIYIFSMCMWFFLIFFLVLREYKILFPLFLLTGMLL